MTLTVLWKEKIEQDSGNRPGSSLPCESWQKRKGAGAKVVMWKYKEVSGFKTQWAIKSVGLEESV